MLRYDGPLLSTPNSTPSVYDMLSARGVTLTQGGMIDYYHSKVSSWLEAIIIHLSFAPVADDEAEDSGSGSGRGVILRLRFLGWGSDCEQRVEIRGDDDTVVAMDILPFKAVTQDKVRVIVNVCMYVCIHVYASISAYVKIYPYLVILILPNW